MCCNNVILSCYKDDLTVPLDKALTLNITPSFPENQSKELAEMLAQEDLGEMGLSSPSEQVAYLLVERATLLERLEAAERRLDNHSLTGNLREVQLQVQDRPMSKDCKDSLTLI